MTWPLQQGKRIALQVAYDRLASKPLRMMCFGAQVLTQLQGCQHVCRLAPDGLGAWEGRSYVLMELLGMNLAEYQRAHPHNGRIHPTEVKRIGAGLRAPSSSTCMVFWELAPSCNALRKD